MTDFEKKVNELVKQEPAYTADAYSFVAEANFRLVSVENGGNVFNQTFKVVLPSDLIKKALEQDEKADLLELIMQSFTLELNKVIPEK